MPLATPDLLVLPARLEPYGAAKALPVFDAAGRLVGLALPAETGILGNVDRILPVSLLSQALPGTVKLGMAAPKGASPPASADMIYETGLKATLQVITAP